MIAHRKEFDASIQDKICDRIERLYRNQFTAWCDGTTCNDEEIKGLKDGFQEIGKLEEYSSRIQLLEESRKGAENFMTYCEKNYDSMDENASAWVIRHISTMLNSKEEAQLKRASTFLRSRLEKMDIGTLYQAVNQIYYLENPKQ